MVPRGAAQPTMLSKGAAGKTMIAPPEQQPYAVEGAPDPKATMLAKQAAKTQVAKTGQPTTLAPPDKQGPMALPEGDFAISATRLYRHDLETGVRDVHEFGEGRYPGEFVFVPRSAEAPEGDGWMIGLVVDLPNETTDPVILDATHFADTPVASIRIQHRVPPGFHGNWVANG